ncbi:hypothetical protein [Candidatus Ichthyocystis sparus]|uniref:hypothetical protein n=1 Tax=Candidatus Ichthyocystis sparus TaxID=1561004 RepID=UPI000B803AAE|nr:hypothetical protein [Candidatus Ichthyocystis sparus]
MSGPIHSNGMPPNVSYPQDIYSKEDEVSTARSGSRTLTKIIGGKFSRARREHVGMGDKLTKVRRSWSNFRSLFTKARAKPKSAKSGVVETSSKHTTNGEQVIRSGSFEAFEKARSKFVSEMRSGHKFGGVDKSRAYAKEGFKRGLAAGYKKGLANEGKKLSAFIESLGISDISAAIRKSPKDAFSAAYKEGFKRGFKKASSREGLPA